MVSDNERRGEDPFERLTELDPLAAGRGATPDLNAKAALFKEITMPTNSNTPVIDRAPAVSGDRLRNSDQMGRRRPWFFTGAIAMTAVAATLALIAAAVITLSPSSTSAAAALVAAADRTSGFESGRIEMTIDVRSIEADPGLDGLNQSIDYHFDGEDLRFDFTQTGPLEPADVSVLKVADRSYFSDGSGPFQVTDLTGDPDTVDPKELIELFWGLDTDSLDPKPLVDLVAAAEDLSQESVDGVERYAGTVASAALVEQLDLLPAGLSMVAAGDDPLAELPPSLAVTVTVTDGTISSVGIDLVGETSAAGAIDAALKLDYSELGQPQNIEAPAADQIDG